MHLFDDWGMPTASPALLERLDRPTLQTFGRVPLLGDMRGRWSGWFERFGGTLPTRFVAAFDDSETLHRAAAEGLGIVLGRYTLMRPLVDAGLPVPLFEQRLNAEFAHYLVYPPRSQNHAGPTAFREWLLPEAQAYAEQLAVAANPPRRRKHC